MSSQDVVDDISSCIRNANTKELSSYFSSTVSMALVNDEGVYSKVQAEIILRDFFSRNPPTAISMVHLLESNPNFKYVVLNMTSSKRSFRISYKLLTANDSFTISELRIE